MDSWLPTEHGTAYFTKALMRMPLMFGRAGASRMSASKKAVNLSVDAALLREARERDINLSATLERALEDMLRQGRRARWVAENKSRIEAYNADVETHGAFADTLRTF
jgi:antitoxin CcdA